MAKVMFSISVIMTVLTTVACSDSVAPVNAGVAPVKAATIEVSSIAEQKAFTGMAVDSDPEVIVRDGRGSPIAGIRVSFTVIAGGGAVAHATDISDAQGRATAGRWMLGSSFGVNTLVASADGAGSVRFNAEGVAVPTGTFQLVTVDGEPLPFPGWLDQIPLVAGTISLTASWEFKLVLQMDFNGSAWESQTVGSFVPRLPSSLSFYIGAQPWKNGTVQGDTLTIAFSPTGEPVLEFIKAKSE